MIYPAFPSKDSLIGICATSAGIGHKCDSFDLSLEALHDLGLHTIETPSVRINAVRPSSGKQRAEELHSLLDDPHVSAIMCATGGEYNFEVLPYIDWSKFTDHPKWFCGYSDPTNIEYYVTTGLDIATIYGVNAGSFDWRPLHDFQKTALDVIAGNIPVQHSYSFWDSARDWENICIDTPVSWDVYFPECIEKCNDRTLDVTGRIIGGCTDVISNLIGTPFDGTDSFIERYKDDGIIWYFDTFEMSHIALHLTMLKMKYAGYFRNTKAVIFGRVMLPCGSADEEYIENLQIAFPDIPFVWGADIGHTKPAFTIINGSFAHLVCRDGKAELEMSLK